MKKKIAATLITGLFMLSMLATMMAPVAPVAEAEQPIPGEFIDDKPVYEIIESGEYEYLRTHPVTFQTADGSTIDGYFGAEQEQTRATWYNGNWDYRRRIRLTGSGTEYTNLTIRVDLNATLGFSNASFDHVKANGADIRFTDDDHDTLQPCWKEYWNDTWHDATMWVKLETVAATGSTDYWMYYGNDAASEVWNGTGTFRHFDTFSGTGYDIRYDAEGDGPIDYNSSNVYVTTMWEKSNTVDFQPDGSTYWYEENTTLMGVSVGYYQEVELKRKAGKPDPQPMLTDYDWHLCYGSLWNDSHNYTVNGAYSDTAVSSWTRYTNNPLINISLGEENPDSQKCTEPDWVHDATANERKEIVKDAGSNFVIYYSALNDTGWSICAANSTDSSTPDAQYFKAGAMLTREDVDWAYDVRKPVVWVQGEEDYRMLFTGYDSENKWQIGYATAATILGPWTAHTTPVLNTTAYGFYSSAIIPTDFWYNGTHSYCSFGGMDGDNDWRGGIATCKDSDMITNWDVVYGHVPHGNSLLNDADQDDCQYGSWTLIEDGEGDHYLEYFFTMRNETHISMSHEAARNTTWEHFGANISCYCLWDADEDGEIGLYVDTNETYLINGYGEYEEGGAAYYNLSITTNLWARHTGQTDNVSVVGRCTDAPLHSGGHYASELNVTGSTINSVCMLGGSDAQIDTGTLADVFSESGDQVHLNLWMKGDEISSYVENMPDNYTGSANGSDESHMNGKPGILAWNCPTEYDWFRVSNAGPAGGGTWSMGDESTAQTPGGGGATAADDNNPPTTGGGSYQDETDAGMCWWGIIILLLLGLYGFYKIIEGENTALGLALIIIAFLGTAASFSFGWV